MSLSFFFIPPPPLPLFPFLLKLGADRLPNQARIVSITTTFLRVVDFTYHTALLSSTSLTRQIYNVLDRDNHGHVPGAVLSIKISIQKKDKEKDTGEEEERGSSW